LKTILSFTLWLIGWLSTIPLFAQSVEERPRFRHEWRIEGGALLGGIITLNNFTARAGLGLQTVHSLRLHKGLSIGVGMGINRYPDVTLLPLMVELKAPFKKPPAHTFVFAQFGYAPGWSSGLYHLDDYDFRGGLVFHPGIAIKALKSRGHALLITIGYKWQKTRITFNPHHNSEKLRSPLDYHFLTLRAGLCFFDKK